MGVLLDIWKWAKLTQKSGTWKTTKNVATHTLVMMAQSCMKKVTVPVATFASCGGASASELYFVVWEVVGKLELYDIHVRGFVRE